MRQHRNSANQMVHVIGILLQAGDRRARNQFAPVRRSYAHNIHKFNILRIRALCGRRFLSLRERGWGAQLRAWSN